MGDRLDELAKQMPKQASSPSPTPDADVNLWAPDTGTTSAPKQNVFDKAMQSEPITKEHPIKSTLNNLGAGATRAVFGNDPRGLMHDLSSGNPAYSLGESLVKPFVENPSGESVAAIPQLLMMGLGGGEAAAAEPKGGGLINGNPLKDYASPVIPRAEGVARAATDIFKPASATQPNAISTLTREAPAYLDYAKRTNNPLRTPLEHGVAMRGAGREASDLLNNEVWEPNKYVETGHGPLGQVRDRIRELNAMLAPDYRKPTTGQALDAVERRGVQDELRPLNEAMYSTAGERSGLKIDTLRSINQRGGSLLSLGDEVDAAQRMRRQGMASDTHIPYSNIDKGLRLLQYLRGGPERVAGRRLGEIFGQVENQPEPLPAPEQIRQHRMGLESTESENRNLLTEQRGKQSEANYATAGKRLPPPETIELKPTEVNPQPELNSRAQRLAERMQSRNALPPPEEPNPPRSTSPFDKYLTEARARQELVRKAKK